ncbi:MAG TPA: amidase family protein [Polyangium sp.]|nr:amidase family protein [Polyangium sp.]
MSDWATLARLDGIAQAELCAKGEVTAAELHAAAMRRIEALNALLRPVVTIHREHRSSGNPSVLSGVPFLVKDASPWPGVRWSIGSRLFAKNFAPAHPPYGSRLDAAGLQCLGKTATSEFGLLGSTETLFEGATLNPWNLSYSAAGSSGGSAAAVAAGLVPLAHANDGGGSIRIPASVCGLFGFKPSKGRTLPAAFASTDFIDMTSDHCISRSVRDSAAFLALTEDPAHPDPVGFVREPLQRPLRIGTWTQTAMGDKPEPAVQAAYEDALRLLDSLGHRIEPMNPPAVDGPVLGDAFFLAAGATVAGVVEQMDAMRGEPVQHHELEPFTWSLVERYQSRGPRALEQARDVFAQAVRAYREITRPYDVIVTPTVATEPWRLGHLSPVLSYDELMRRTARTVGYTPIHNIAGCPSMSVPLCFPENGMPIGTLFSAAPGADALLFGLAYQLEMARPWKNHWPAYSIPVLFG